LRKLKYVVAEEEIHHLVKLLWILVFVTLGYWIYCNKAVSNKFRLVITEIWLLAIEALLADFFPKFPFMLILVWLPICPFQEFQE